jgi:hypothetical protein
MRRLTAGERAELEALLSDALTYDVTQAFVMDPDSCLYGDKTLAVEVSFTEEKAGSTFCE